MTDVNRKLADELRLIAQEVLAEAHANHNATIAELSALRGGVDIVRMYLRDMERSCTRALDAEPAEVGYIRGKVRGRLEAYRDVERRLTAMRFGLETEVIDGG